MMYRAIWMNYYNKQRRPSVRLLVQHKRRPCAQNLLFIETPFRVAKYCNGARHSFHTWSIPMLTQISFSIDLNTQWLRWLVSVSPSSVNNSPPMSVITQHTPNIQLHTYSRQILRCQRLPGCLQKWKCECCTISFTNPPLLCVVFVLCTNVQFTHKSTTVGEYKCSQKFTNVPTAQSVLAKPRTSNTCPFAPSLQ